MLARIEEIGEAIGRAEAAGFAQDLRLRRANRVRSVQGTLAIEGNRLSQDQVASILDGKPVAAPPREVQEARNAINAYDRLEQWRPHCQTDLLDAHRVLMTALLDAPGHYRQGKVVVAGREGVQHIAPPAPRVPQLMAELLAWLKGTEEHSLLASSVFHYEFEFIHPFEDGNGRMGRLWQTLILARWRPLFAHIPVESLILARQADYYHAIRRSSAEGESTAFIEFMLEVIVKALPNSRASDQEDDQVSDQVAQLLRALQNGPKTATELMAGLGLKHRPSFRKNHLQPALSAGLVEMTHPESPTAKTQRYRLTPKGMETRCD